MFRDVSLKQWNGAVSAELVEKMIDVLAQPAETNMKGLSPAVLRWLDGRDAGATEPILGRNPGGPTERECRDAS